MPENTFGYPVRCDLCADLGDAGRALNVAPFFREGGHFRLMPAVLEQQEDVLRMRQQRQRRADVIGVVVIWRINGLADQ